MRAIQVTTTCSRCDNGIYRDWDGVSRGTCYTCNGKAKVTLKFIETTIEVQSCERIIPDQSGGESLKATFKEAQPTRLVWHSPIEYSSWLGWPTNDLEFSESQDWTVRAEGKPLTTVELAEAMNIVETYWPWWRKESPYSLSRDEYDSSRYYLFNYALDIGAGSKSCELCGGEHDSYCSFTVSPGITRSASVCKACGQSGETWKRLANLPIPQLHPEVQKWRERHSINFEDTWKRGWREREEWQDRKVNGVPVTTA